MSLLGGAEEATPPPNSAVLLNAAARPFTNWCRPTLGFFVRRRDRAQTHGSGAVEVTI